MTVRCETRQPSSYDAAFGFYPVSTCPAPGANALRRDATPAAHRTCDDVPRAGDELGHHEIPAPPPTWVVPSWVDGAVVSLECRVESLLRRAGDARACLHRLTDDASVVDQETST